MCFCLVREAGAFEFPRVFLLPGAIVKVQVEAGLCQCRKTVAALNKLKPAKRLMDEETLRWGR